MFLEFAKQKFHSWLAFYGDSPSGFSGVLSLVHRDLCPVLMFSHDSGGLLGIKITIDKEDFGIINVYGDCVS